MRRAVFLDRDGVINYRAPQGEYVLSSSEFRIIPQVVDWIRLFNALDFLVIVVTNQRCVSLGLTTSDEIERIHENMRNELERLGARIDGVYVCPHGLNDCDCRKPKPGMVLQAAADRDIDVSRSLMIGDSASDKELAANCGMRFIAVNDGKVVDAVQ